MLKTFLRKSQVKIVNILIAIRMLWVSLFKGYDFAKIFILSSPIFLSSFFIISNYVAIWVSSVFLSIFFVLLCSYILFFKTKKISLMSFYILIFGLLFSVVFYLFQSQNLKFYILGYGIYEWTFFGILGLFVIFSTFLNLNISKKALLFLFIPVLYTIGNFFLIKYFPNIAAFTSYVNKPLFSFGYIYNYIFIYSIVVFLSALVSYFIKIKNIDVKNIKVTSHIYFMFLVLFLGFVSYFIISFFKIISIYEYSKGVEYANNLDVLSARKKIDNAIMLYGMDVYYTNRIDVYNYDLNMILQNTSLSDEQKKERLMKIFEKQIEDAYSSIYYNKDNSSNYIALGSIYENMGNVYGDEYYDKALDIYFDARENVIDKDNMDVLIGRLNMMLGKDKEALEAFNRGLTHDPNSISVLFNLGVYYLNKKDYDQALFYTLKSYDIDNTNYKIFDQLGYIYFIKKDYDKAIESFANSFYLSGQKDNSSLYYLALSYKAKGQEGKEFRLIVEELKKRLGKDSKEIEELTKPNNKEEIKTKTKNK